MYIEWSLGSKYQSFHNRYSQFSGNWGPVLQSKGFTISKTGYYNAKNVYCYTSSTHHIFLPYIEMFTEGSMFYEGWSGQTFKSGNSILLRGQEVNCECPGATIYTRSECVIVQHDSFLTEVNC